MFCAKTSDIRYVQKYKNILPKNYISDNLLLVLAIVLAYNLSYLFAHIEIKLINSNQLIFRIVTDQVI